MRLYSTADVSLGGGTAQSIAGVAGTGGWTTVNVGSGFAFTGSNTMTITRSSGFVYIDGIEINGKELVDDNQTPPNVPSIASTVRANPTAGFSIATYTGSSNSGDTLGHGLNAEPELVIVKARTKNDDWRVYHKSVGTGHYLQLNNTNAKTTTGNWQSVSSTTLGLNSDSAVNSSSYTYLALFFAPVAGYSAFGTYTGNGSSSDGTFVWTGFRPRFVMLKNTSSSQATGGFWVMIDTERDPGNNCDNYFSANSAAAEGVTTVMDILSNGFKLSNPYTSTNGSGIEYIYLAFAEHPFKYARAR